MKVSELLKKLLASPAAVKALDEAPTEEGGAEDQGAGAGNQPDVAQVLAAVMARLDQIEAKMNGTAEGDDAAGAGAAAGAEGGEDAGAGAAAGGEGEGSGDPVEKRLAVIEAALAKLVGLEQQEHAAGGAATGDAEMCKDQETIARAEILAPGIAKTADVKDKALTAAYGTEDGKAVIDTVLAGKAFDSADKDMLFIAASELLKSTRRQQLNTRVSLDSLPGMKAGEMTPEKINAMNAERYGKK